MTEAEWLAATSPAPMLRFFGAKASARKRRLFEVACCRQIWPPFTDPRCRDAVLVAERFADRLATEAELKAAVMAVSAVWGTNAPRPPDDGEPRVWPYFTTDAAAHNVALPAELWDGLICFAPPHKVIRDVTLSPDRPTVTAAQSDLLRDIFGNPFRPVPLDPAWRTSTVAALAEGIYADRAFDRLPILADALQDAGCDHAESLDHCRGNGPHARGCWVVDLLLGKQ